MGEVRRHLDREFRPAGYNIGVNAGEAAGQTVPHAHLHVIPRYPGDVEDPRGGVRHVIAGRAAWWPERFERLVCFVEWKLIQMPLPRVQYFGRTHDEFLYSIGWDRSVRRGEVSEYQRTGGGPFDNRIQLRPGVGEHMVLLNALLRPLIHRQWAGMVARMNELEESRLEEFLFGARRIPLDPVRPGLQDLQGDRCFYCGRGLQRSRARRPCVDHFIPWSRYPNNAIENLVVAHERGNGRKRDFLAAAEHVARWRGRLDREGRPAHELVGVAVDARWKTAPARSLNVTRAIYLRLPSEARLWRVGEEFVEAEPGELRAALA